ncbi:MAG: mucoidy inhibitor MuiA family protein [Bacteroidota bacterium]
MKTIIPFLSFLLVSMTLIAQEYVSVDSEISAVTVFPDRAQLTREATLNLEKGKTLLRIAGLSSHIEASSIQVSGQGEFMIIAVNPRMNYLEPTEESEKVKKLRARVRELNIMIEDEKTEIDILREKENFLVANRVVTGKNESINATELKNISELYISSIESVRKGIVQRNRLIKEYEEEKQAIENQLNHSLRESRMPSSEVMVSVSAPSACKGKLTLNYLVTNAGWYPSYDIRVDDISSDVLISYKANVYQNTGRDWENVRFSFSTASPSVSGDIPVLMPWYLNFYSPPVIYNYKSARSAARPEEQKIKADEEMLFEDDIPLTEAAGPPVNIITSQTSFSFEVDIAQNIRSDGKINTIELQQLAAEAHYSYVSVPKLREEAFLTAYIPEWESLNLLNGEANIYFGNTFTGNTMLNTGQISDTLEVSLGRDNSITVKREMRREYTVVRTLGSNRIETRSFEISIRNNKSSDIDILVYDQLPVSQNKDIEVEATELSGGIVNEVSGEIKWKATIAAGSSKDFILTYTVKYPKNQKVILE